MVFDLILLPILIWGLRYLTSESRLKVSTFVRERSVERKKAFMIRFLHQYFAYCSLAFPFFVKYVGDESQYKELLLTTMYILLLSAFISMAATHVTVEEKLKKTRGH